VPTTFSWLIADRRGTLVVLTAERWGVTHRAAPLISDGGAVWSALHAGWVREVAPLLVTDRHDLAMIPESEAPHLVAFVETPNPGLGGRAVSERCWLFEAPTEALRAVLAADEDEDCEAPAILGSLALDEGSFGEHLDSALYRLSRWGDDPRYRRPPGLPRWPLSLDSIAPFVVPILDFDVTRVDLLDLETVLAPADLHECGR
jgi:hypothetical protein